MACYSTIFHSTIRNIFCIIHFQCMYMIYKHLHCLCTILWGRAWGTHRVIYRPKKNKTKITAKTCTCPVVTWVTFRTIDLNSSVHQSYLEDVGTYIMNHWKLCCCVHKLTVLEVSESGASVFLWKSGMVTGTEVARLMVLKAETSLNELSAREMQAS